MSRVTGAEIIYGLRAGTVRALLHFPRGGTAPYTFKASGRRVLCTNVLLGSRESLSREQAFNRFAQYGAQWELLKTGRP